MSFEQTEDKNDSHALALPKKAKSKTKLASNVKVDCVIAQVFDVRYGV